MLKVEGGMKGEGVRRGRRWGYEWRERYDAKNLNRLFATSPHFGAIISYYTTIFCHGHIHAGPRYGICPYQMAGALNKPIYAEKNARNQSKRCKKS